MSPKTANLLLLLAGAVWGMGFVAQVGAMEDIGPMLFMTLRFFIAGLCVLPFAIRELNKANRKFEISLVRQFLPVAAIFFTAMAAQQVGLLATSVTNAGFLTALYVVLVPLILLIVFRERQVWIIWPAALIALVGIFLLSGGEVTALTWGDWLVMGGAVFAALHVIYIGRIGIASGLPVTMATTQFFLSSAFAAIGYFITPHLGIFEPAANLTIIKNALPEILYAAVFAGALAFTLMAVGQRYTSAATAAILLASESLFAALFGAILLSERLSLLGYFGCAMIFASLVIVELNPQKPSEPKSA